MGFKFKKSRKKIKKKSDKTDKPQDCPFPRKVLEEFPISRYLPSYLRDKK